MDMDDKKPIAIIAVALVVFLAGGAWWMSRSSRTAAERHAAGSRGHRRADRQATAAAGEPAAARSDGRLPASAAGGVVVAARAGELAGDRRSGAAAGGGDRSGVGGRIAGARFQGDRARRRRSRRPAAAAAARSIPPAIGATTGWCRPSRRSTPRTSRRSTRRSGRGSTRRISAWAIPTATSIARCSRALDILLDTPVVKDPIALAEGDGAGWVYADDDLEALQPTQKQLLRMGPANVDRLLVWLRALQSALQLTA